MKKLESWEEFLRAAYAERLVQGDGCQVLLQVESQRLLSASIF